MKRNLKRNIVIAAVLVFVGAAVYLNWSYNSRWGAADAAMSAAEDAAMAAANEEYLAASAAGKHSASTAAKAARSVGRAYRTVMEMDPFVLIKAIITEERSLCNRNS